VRRTLACALLVAASCGGPPRPAEEPEPAPGPEPGTGAPYPMVAPSPEIAALAGEFRGSCAFARTPGAAAPYRRQLQVRAGGTRIFATADFESRAQTIGEIDRGVVLAGEGPLATGRGGGAGYAVVVRDPEGRVCRGYVAADAVEPRPGGEAR
jgi:hypothetical protein